MYTMQSATRYVLQNLVPGKFYTGRDLHNMIVTKMRLEGNMSNPYDSSTLRSVRRFASLYGVTCVLAREKSKYRKETLL